MLLECISINDIHRIDSFDNSNLFGSFAVSGMVVYKNGQPSKNDYRKYFLTSPIPSILSKIEEIEPLLLKVR